MARSAHGTTARPRPIRWMILWFLVFGIVGVGVTDMLRSEMRGYSLVFATLVWGAIGVAFATALRAGEPRSRGRRVRR